MVPSLVLAMCMDLHWIDRNAVRPLPCVLALVMTAVHFGIT
jgi:hypothetical protein